MIFTQLYNFTICKMKFHRKVSGQIHNVPKSDALDKFANIQNDFDMDVKKQNEALLQIINRTINNVPVDTTDLDIEKELEKIRTTKLQKRKKWFGPTSKNLTFI